MIFEKNNKSTIFEKVKSMIFEKNKIKVRFSKK